MGWYIAEVRDENRDTAGYCIVDSVTEAVVRPLSDHPQSIFDEVTAHAIAKVFERKYGDPRYDHMMLVSFRNAPDAEQLLDLCGDVELAAAKLADWLEANATFRPKLVVQASRGKGNRG